MTFRAKYVIFDKKLQELNAELDLLIVWWHFLFYTLIVITTLQLLYSFKLWKYHHLLSLEFLAFWDRSNNQRQKSTRCKPDLSQNNSLLIQGLLNIIKSFFKTFPQTLGTVFITFSVLNPMEFVFLILKQQTHFSEVKH